MLYMSHSIPLASDPGILLRKTILVHNPADTNHESAEVAVSYRIDYDEDIALISCMVEMGPITLLPSWLRVRKFEARARRSKGYYTMLYSEGSDDFGIDTSLFIERVAFQIMNHENI